MTPEDLLENLDAEQREAATSLVGPVCILAGAGTGKTRTITHRIAYGISKGYFAANRIMALTYTNRAAGELRARLRSLGIPGVSVKTFHAAALSQLDYFWPQYAGVPAPSVLESKAKMLSEVASNLKINLDTAATRELAAEIEWRKFSMLSLAEYSDLVSSRPKVAGLSVAKNLEIQAAYEAAKIAAQRIDWEDVLVLTLGLLRAEPLALAHVQQQYRFYTVDEYQDISPLQHSLLELWLGEHTELCVVGDPNQTIYSFTGATSEYLQNFADRYENAKVVQLTRNYRSTQQVVAMANRLTAESAMEPLESQGEIGFAPTVREFSSVSEEATSVAADIKELIASGTKASQIAVLYRINAQSEAIENALSSQGIGYQVRGGERFFARPEIQAAMRSIRAESLVDTGKSLFESVSEICRTHGWQAMPPTDLNANLERWESLNSLISIVEELPAGSNLIDFAKELDERQRSQHEPVKEAVTLSTIHAAKGLEWQSVFVCGVSEGYLPIGYAKTEREIYEEQRLLYVALTRARRDLSISWAKRDALGLKDREPSRFVSLLRSSSHS
jgi:DNA helicase II / ATP-dependent DNA helicase PcrA